MSVIEMGARSKRPCHTYSYVLAVGFEIVYFFLIFTIYRDSSSCNEMIINFPSDIETHVRTRIVLVAA